MQIISIEMTKEIIKHNGHVGNRVTYNSTCKIRRDIKESICLRVTQCHTSVPGDKVPFFRMRGRKIFLIHFCLFLLHLSVLFHFTVNNFHALYLGKI